MRDGTVIAGRYRLDAKIGDGGMATVWRGMDLSLSREVAVKVLREELAAQPDAVSRFRREAHAAAKMNHQNIVQIYDTGVDGDDYYIVMEYLPEPDLKKIINDWAPLPEEKVIEVASQCCRALGYAHSNGLIHRDVKPHNILFTDDGRAKLSDFGIAAAVGTGGVTPGGFVLGSAHYISPEQGQGSPAGPHSDVYSLGCVLYEALSGRPPFEGKTEAEIAAKHIRERPPSLRSLNPNVSPSTEFIVTKAMAREVARRYRSAEEMLADLAKLAGGEELDRTGVLAAPEAATTVLQPTPPVAPAPPPPTPPTPPPPTVVSAGGDMEVEPARPARTAPPPAEAAPTLAPPTDAKSTAWGAVAATIIAVIALAIVVWMGKTVFYPGGAGKMVQVPLLTGMTLSEARLALEAAELTQGEITFDEDSLQPEGRVIAQSPEAGGTTRTGTTVDLVVNRGTELVLTVSVEGMTLQEANEALEKAGLSVGEVSQVFHATIPAGSVIKQALKPGTKVERGAGIDLQVSKGPEAEEPEPEPDDTPVDDEPVQVEDPHVTVVQDESYVSSNPAERKFIVTVTAQGQELGQRLQVMKQDDTGGRVAVLTVKLDPNEKREVPVITEGAAIIEVVHNDRVVYKETKPAPPIPDNGAQPGDDSP